jgi:hypothetical protein
MTYSPRPADLIFTHNESFLGRAIRWFTRHRGEGPTYANHVAGVIPRMHVKMICKRLAAAEEYTKLDKLQWMLLKHPGEYWFVLEALWTVKISPLAGYKDEHQVYRHVGLMQTQRHNCCKEASKYYGRRYGVLKLGLHAGDAGLAKIFGRDVYFFRRLARMDDYPICSWLWAWAYERGVKYEAWGESNAVSPDCMHDHVVKSEDWERVAAKMSMIAG